MVFEHKTLETWPTTRHHRTQLSNQTLLKNIKRMMMMMTIMIANLLQQLSDAYDLSYNKPVLRPTFQHWLVSQSQIYCWGRRGLTVQAATCKIKPIQSRDIGKLREACCRYLLAMNILANKFLLSVRLSSNDEHWIISIAGHRFGAELPSDPYAYCCTLL